MSQENKPKRKLNRLHIILIALALISVLVTGATFSSYKSVSDGGDSVTVALFASDMNYTLDVPAADFYPGFSKEFDVVVTNYDDLGNADPADDKICEVSQSFTFTAELLMERLPLEITLVKKEGPANNEFNIIDGMAIKQYAIFTVTISWPDTDEAKDYKYATEIDVVRLTVAATQIN